LTSFGNVFSIPLFTMLICPIIVAVSSPARADLVPSIKFQDDFKGVERSMPDGSRKLYPDTEKWAFTFWPGTKWPDSYGDGTNWLNGNAECQTYLSALIGKVKGQAVPLNLRYDPFSIEDDGLHIKAAALSKEQMAAYQVEGPRRFGSGILMSRQSFKYGRITMVARLPSARGSWPAFWLLPESHEWPPEIDVFEGMAWGPHSRQIRSGLLGSEEKDQTSSQWFDLGVDPSKDFHEYALDWNAETISMSFDGKTLWTRPTPCLMHQNMYMLANLAVGGKWPYNELGVNPVDGMSRERLMIGSDLIAGDYPAEMIIKSISVAAD